MTIVFETITREAFIAKLRELAASTESLSLLADAQAGTDEIVASYLTMFGGNNEDAKACFDTDLANLISETLQELGFDEAAHQPSLDYLAPVYDELERNGISWD